MMIELFNEYKNSNKINEALVVGKNMVNKNPGNCELFRAYMDLLLSLAEKLPSVTDKKEFVAQANITLAFFLENADLSKELIDEIGIYEKKINIIVEEIGRIETDKNNAVFKEIEIKNKDQIGDLRKLKQRLMKVKSQTELDEVLQAISLADAKIEHDYLTDEQKVHYDQLNKECTSCISDRMRYIEHTNNVAYNKRAVDAFDSAFKKFKGNEAHYKSQTQLFELVSTTLFAFNAARLFNETLIYYNHVYSYIFSKLDDEGKYALTRFSIQCERRLR